MPAQLAYLTIYNPAFGDTDETAYEQIFYYYSRKGNEDKEKIQTPQEKFDSPEGGQTSEEDEKNEQLRQVGLARGMVEFAK